MPLTAAKFMKEIDDYLDNLDKTCIEKMNNILERTRKLDNFFDAFETNVDLFEKQKIVYEMLKSSDKHEILSLWEKFKILDKKTRI